MSITKKIVAVAAAVMVLAAAGADIAEAKKGSSGSGGNTGNSGNLRYRCNANAAPDISMASKWEVKKGRQRFQVEFEAGPATTLTAGTALTLAVGGVEVGVGTLELIGTDLVIEIQYDSKVSPSGDERAFPANFPRTTIGSGTQVEFRSGVTPVLGCVLG